MDGGTFNISLACSRNYCIIVGLAIYGRTDTSQNEDDREEEKVR